MKLRDIPVYKRVRLTFHLNFLKIVFIGEGRKQKGVPQVVSTKKETAGVEVLVPFSYFSSKMWDLNANLVARLNSRSS